MHRAESVGVERDPVRRHLTGGLQIDRLAADHPGRSRRVGDRLNHAQFAPGQFGPGEAAVRLAREERKRLGMQAVACEDGDAVAVHDMQRRPPAPERVVVHRREIVVNERVSMNELDRAGAGQCELDRGIVAPAARDGVGRGERQHGPEPFASGEHAVAHRLAHDARACRRHRQVVVERRVHAGAARFEKGGERIGGRTHDHPRSASSAGLAIEAGAGLRSPRSVRISIRRSASSRRA